MTASLGFQPVVRVQQEDFDPGELQEELVSGSHSAGAVVAFTGVVRSEASDPVLELQLEHYPGMTESSIRSIVEEARQRWAMLAVIVVHRVGALAPGDRIVYVGVSSPHRGDAFHACEFIMDYLKTRAPFWKKEVTAAGERWVEARDSDDQSAERWRSSPK